MKQYLKFFYNFMTFAGHFLEEKDSEMETLDEGNGYDDSGMSGWSFAG